MSDDESSGLPTPKRSKPLHFGSLATEASVERIRAMGVNAGEPDPAVVQARSAASDYAPATDAVQLDKIADPQKEMMLAEFDRRRRARTLTLPTDDGEVKLMLRQLGCPICLFGEQKPDRRERLRSMLSSMDAEAAHQILHFRDQPLEQKPRLDEATWYHEGSSDLRQARLFIAKYSLPRAKRRLDKARVVKEEPAQQRALRLQETHKWVRRIVNYGSQVGDVRPVSFCEFSPDSQLIATAGWSGLCKLWTSPECRQLRAYRGHNTNASCVRFHPQATKGMDPSLVNLASCGHDGSVFLWNLESDDPLAELEGHSVRVSRIAFHPSGRFLATCCHDQSWRLFDLEANDEVLFQEGHSKAVFDIAFQCDGSVALTGGLDGYGRVWDLRTGRCIMFLEGHQKEVVTVAFSPNGYHMASGSADNCAKIWDLRMRRCVYTIPAHTSLISRLRFDDNFGDYLVMGSFDSTVSIWTHPGWQRLKQLSGHDSKVMCVDISPCGKWIMSSSYDRTFKLWTTE